MIMDAHNPFIASECEEDRDEIISIRNHYYRNKAFDIHPQVCVYYDAWGNDNDEDPIMSLVYAIINNVDTDYIKAGASIMEAFTGRNSTKVVENLMSRDRIDQYRKWSHCRSSMGTPLSLEQISEGDEGDDTEPADPKGEFEDELLSKIRMEAFLQHLPERDRQIFELKMQGLTDQTIAEKVGFRNHSAVVKRRKQIAKQFLEYTDEENLKETNS